MVKPTGLIIGRFQPFHNGHVKLIEYAAGESGKVIIGIGSSQESHSWENPFSASERREMIKKSLKVFDRYEIIEVPDINKDLVWVSHVKRIAPDFQVVYANTARERHLFSEAGFDVVPTPFFSRDLYSGTEIRRRIAMNEKWMWLVPQGTIDVIKKIDGVRRIKDLSLII